MSVCVKMNVECCRDCRYFLNMIGLDFILRFSRWLLVEFFLHDCSVSTSRPQILINCTNPSFMAGIEGALCYFSADLASSENLPAFGVRLGPYSSLQGYKSNAMMGSGD